MPAKGIEELGTRGASANPSDSGEKRPWAADQENLAPGRCISIPAKRAKVTGARELRGKA
jgi:hypothetical protein